MVRKCAYEAVSTDREITQTYIHFARKKDVPFTFVFNPSDLEKISSSHIKKATIGTVIRMRINQCMLAFGSEMIRRELVFSVLPGHWCIRKREKKTHICFAKNYLHVKYFKLVTFVYLFVSCWGFSWLYFWGVIWVFSLFFIIYIFQ